MTPDDPHRPRPDEPSSGAPTVDELASALLDGALDDAEAEAARARPDVVARAAEMDAARAALRAGVPAPAPSAEARDRALAAALAAFDEAGAPADAAATGSGRGEVPDLASRRSSWSGQADRHRGDGRRRGAPRWLGAAAAAVALVASVAGLAAISSGGSDDDESAEGGDAAATAQEDSEPGTSDGDSGDEATAAAPEASGESEDSGGSTPATTIPVEAGDLGAFPSVDDLVDRVDGLADGAYGVVTPDVAARSSADALDQFAPACAGGLPESLAGPEVTLRLHATAVVADQPVDVWSTEGPGGRRVVVLAADCTVVADRPVG